MESSEAASINPPKKSPICEECKLNPSKYTCPGCSLRSCSLPCVKSHKERTSCTGKRSRTQFVPLSQFDDNLLISDYNLLEEVKGATETAQRLRTGLCGIQKLPIRLPNRLKFLMNAARRRRIKLFFLPSGMFRRKNNSSWYNFKKKSIFWTIEWRFHSTTVVLTDHEVDESISITSLIEKHLNPGPVSHQLKSFCKEELECLKLFISMDPKTTKSCFYELDIKAPLNQQLHNIAIIEYPVIHVYLPSSNIDFPVTKTQIILPSKSSLQEPITDDVTSPKGIYFKEEEIEDGDSSDLPISDLMKHPSITKSLLQELGIEDDDTYYNSNVMEFGQFEGDCFDFGQNLEDVYSDLIDKINPDGFLDLEGLLLDEEEGIANTELEEGEILE